MNISSLILIAGGTAFFLGVVIVLINVLTAGLGRAGVTRGLNAIHNVYAAGGQGSAAGDRVVVVTNRMNWLGRAGTSGRALRWLRRWLDYAGNPPAWAVDRVFEIKGLGLIVGGILGIVVGLVFSGGSGAVFGGIAFAAVGFFFPDAVIYQLGYKRQEDIQLTLPDIMDTLTVSVEAGLGFDAALAQVTRFGKGPLAGEIARVLQEMQIGRSRVDALRAMAQRTRVQELKTFCATVVQASELGIPIASVLREQSKEMRIRRRQRAEELAQKVPVKILFPLIFCLFPSLFIVVLGPGAISLLHTALFK
jgi:tight adherence protein C